jgi:hypothetical protein
MIKLIAILTACMTLVACSLGEVSPTAQETMLGAVGCSTLGAPLKQVRVYNHNTDNKTVTIYCGDGSIRIEVDLPIRPPVVKDLPKQLKGA